MRFGAMNFPVKALQSEIEDFADMGFDFLELTMDPPRAHYTRLRSEKNEIRRRLHLAHMGLVCHLPTFVYTADLTESIRRASVQEIMASLETARDLEAEKAVLHPGYIGGMGAFVMETSRKYALESLSAIATKAHELGMVLCLENMFPRYLSFVEPEDFRAVFEQFPSMKLTLDTGHANIEDNKGDRALRFLKMFIHRLGHVHVSDNHGKKDEHLPVGAGSVPLGKIAKVLKREGYDDTITLEIFTENRHELTASRERIRKMLRV